MVARDTKSANGNESRKRDHRPLGSGRPRSTRNSLAQIGDQGHRQHHPGLNHGSSTPPEPPAPPPMSPAMPREGPAWQDGEARRRSPPPPMPPGAEQRGGEAEEEQREQHLDPQRHRVDHRTDHHPDRIPQPRRVQLEVDRRPAGSSTPRREASTVSPKVSSTSTQARPARIGEGCRPIRPERVADMGTWRSARPVAATRIASGPAAARPTMPLGGAGHQHRSQHAKPTGHHADCENSEGDPEWQDDEKDRRPRRGPGERRLPDHRQVKAWFATIRCLPPDRRRRRSR